MVEKKEVETEILKADDPKLKEYVEDELYDKLQEDIELLEKTSCKCCLNW